MASQTNNGLSLVLATKNPALQVTADRKLRMVDAPILKPKAGQVLVHIKAVGVCGSDIHFWKSGRVGPINFTGDCILGHEAAGMVVDVGDDVKDLKHGDRVALEPGVPCDNCFLCRDGRYNLCEDVQFMGVYPYDGAIQRYKVHPAKWVHKLPDNLTYSQGALLEPLSVIMHAINITPVSLGRGAVICGAGPIGMIALAAARASGAHPLLITDLESERLRFAEQFVPSCQTYKVDRDLNSEENAKRIREKFCGGGPYGAGDGSGEYFAPDTVFECTGVETSIATATHVARRGGTVMVVGVGKPTINNFPFMHASMSEIDLRFINRYRDTWPAGISALSGKVLDLDKLVTHIFPLAKAVGALELAADPSQGSIKVHIVDEDEP